MATRTQQFLTEVAKATEPGVFTPRIYEFFREYLEASPPRHFGGKYIVNNFIPPFPGKAFGKFLGTFFAEADVNRQEAWRHALEAHNVADLYLDGFRGVSAWPEKYDAIVQE